MRLLFSFLIYFSIIAYADICEFSLGNLGNVRYTYDDRHLIKIERLNCLNELLYTHSYRYDENGKLVSENLIGNLGEVIYEGDLVIRSPYHHEICEYDTRHNLIKHNQDGVLYEYEYDDSNRIIIEDEFENCIHDDFGNLTHNGNVKFVYDNEHKLVQSISCDFIIDYVYDSSGKLISRTINGETSNYLHFGNNEIAIFDNTGELEELRIPGLSTHNDIFRPIAVETKYAIYAPIHDIQGNIVKLIDISNREVVSLSIPDPYGRGLSKKAPTSWIFAGKYYDKEADIVYFGNRFYCPRLKQWLTPDPFKQTSNLYQYCLDNPFSYIDPDGRWAVSLLNIVWGAGTIITAPLWTPYALVTAAGAAMGYISYKAYEHWQANHKSEPPYNGKELGKNPEKKPAQGFEWRGKGSPGSGKGNWYNPNTGERLHPDLNHPEPKGPHWGYKGPHGEEYDLYLDGSWK